MAVLRSVDCGSLPTEFSIADPGPREKFVVAYSLEFAITDLSDTLNAMELIAIKPLGAVAIGALARKEGTDFRLVRHGLTRVCNRSRGYPRTRFEFTVIFGGLGQEVARNIESAAQGGTRRLFDNDEDQICLTEPLNGTGVRESEILVANHRADGQ